MLRLLPVVAALIGLAVACGDNGSSPTLTPVPSQVASPAPTQPSPTSSPQASPTPSPEPTGPLPSVQLQRIFTGATFSQPTGMYQAPDGRVFVLEQRGQILVFDDLEASEGSVFLDLATARNMSGGYEEGLLGFALHPDFQDNGQFFVYYSAADPRRSIISRFDSTPTGVDPESELVILEVPQPASNHKAGQIVFGPDGYLYVALGDGGGSNDPNGHGQNKGSVLGAILRIDVRNATLEQPYTVPQDNPFVGEEGARAEIWAYGFRNPWRFSFDAVTGEMWVGDVGQAAREEIDLVVKGGNYGWSIMEGFECRGGGIGCSREGLLLPVVDYPTTGANCAVTGGFVYRGEAIPDLRGAYVYADYCSRVITALRYDGSTVTEQAEVGLAEANISSFAVDNAGELYVVGHGPSAGIFRLVP